MGISVDGAKLAEEVLADLEALDASGEAALSLTEAERLRFYQPAQTTDNHESELMHSEDVAYG